MSSKMKVQELRDALSKRGLETSGPKSVLVARLDGAISEEKEEQSKKSIGAAQKDSSRKPLKRVGDNEDEETVAASKIAKTDDLETLTISELRDSLKNRGLSVAGNKKTLLTRLQNALKEGRSQDIVAEDAELETEEEEEQSKKSIGAAQNNPTRKPLKRVGDNEDEEMVTASKIAKTDDLEMLTIAELRDALKNQGLSVAGNKKTLLTRLQNALKEGRYQNIVEEDAELETGDDKVKEEKLVVAMKKGRAVLDNYLPDHIKSKCHVLETKDGIYDALLNQTNVGDNNNKFYIIQVLESDSELKYHVYNRWGRVGARGQDKLFGPYINSYAAIREFEAKFLDKTRNRWEDRHNFEPYPNKYTLLERDFDDAEPQKPDANDIPKASQTIDKPPRESKLDKRLADLISMICNLNMMKQQMMEIGYDANKMPLGKLSKATILKGYEVLKRIAAVLEGSAQGSLERLSSEFYTVIPHDFGFRRMSNFIINSPQLLKRKLEMVEALGEIQLATKLLSDGDDAEEEDHAYAHYIRLKCDLEPLDDDSDEVSWIKQYLHKTHAETHQTYNLELAQAFRARRDGEDHRFKEFVGTKNRMLLWHGSRLTNWTGILSQGLRIAPPEAPVTGYMFGKGVYFADMVSKSANYCYTTQRDPDGVLLLCEVALGDMHELLNADYNADKLPSGKLSTKGVGGTEPNPKEYITLPDGVIVPMGKPVESKSKGALLYNEYIVYNVAQIRMRYVLQVKFNFKWR